MTAKRRVVDARLAIELATQIDAALHIIEGISDEKIELLADHIHAHALIDQSLYHAIRSAPLDAISFLGSEEYAEKMLDPSIGTSNWGTINGVD